MGSRTEWRLRAITFNLIVLTIFKLNICDLHVVGNVRVPTWEQWCSANGSMVGSHGKGSCEFVGVCKLLGSFEHIWRKSQWFKTIAVHILNTLQCG